MNNGDKPIRNPYVILREEFDDWAILFDPDSGHGFGLNPTGVFVWKLLDGAHSSDDLLRALHRDIQKVPQEAVGHIVMFVDELAGHGLVRHDQVHNHGEPPTPTLSDMPDKVLKRAWRTPHRGFSRSCWGGLH